MKICIATQSSKNYFNQRMLQEAQQKALPIEFFNPYTTDIPHGGTFLLWRISGVTYDDSDLQMARGFKGVIQNPIDTLQLCRDKWTLYQTLKNHLPLGKCFKLAAGWEHLTEHHEWPAMIKDSEFVLKTIRGNQGLGVELITEKSQWQRALNQCRLKNDWRYFIQPRYFGEEYRIFLLEGNSPVILKRNRPSGSKSFKANFHQNGSASLVKTNMFNELILDIERHIKFNYLALDVLVDQGSPTIIDINAVCGIEQLEQVTNQNLAQRILSNLITAPR